MGTGALIGGAPPKDDEPVQRVLRSYQPSPWGKFSGIEKKGEIGIFYIVSFILGASRILIP